MAREKDCGERLPDVWDQYGSFVCGLEPGHQGKHRSRPRKRRKVIEWDPLSKEVLP